MILRLVYLHVGIAEQSVTSNMFNPARLDPCLSRLVKAYGVNILDLNCRFPLSFETN